MVCDQCASHPMSAVCNDFESITTTPMLCAAYSCSGFDISSYHRKSVASVHKPIFNSLISMLVRWNFLISAATMMSVRSRAWFGHSMDRWWLWSWQR
ncbi:hypothetical protein DPMN_088066 [Dreissena polymorpha]|uniref:Uncharacterized protein n=1 Tax=Dreissena polymorpha TaxID=45954 RepID=A0A9D4KUD3_DREPO|nr:hypothetical protein DPMN_088066 [Dreissena polymorpha]